MIKTIWREVIIRELSDTTYEAMVKLVKDGGEGLRLCNVRVLARSWCRCYNTDQDNDALYVLSQHGPLSAEPIESQVHDMQAYTSV